MASKTIYFLFAIIFIVYFIAVGVDTIDVDSSQYAAISREMKESGSYLQVYEQGKDYLDKPPFLFWISSLSMMLFGENNLGFKFASILFAIFSIFATYRFSKLFYTEIIAKISAIVLASSQALFLITNDIRTDTILMGWVIIAIWQLAEWIQKKKVINFILASAAIGAGMLTKGPIALLVPIFAFGSHFFLQRKFHYFFKPIYLLGLVVIIIVLIPMSIGLYKQFDLHPEKTVNGLKNVSGLRFFYWTQSFGRITGENVWNNNAPFSFLFQNLLWGLLPWTLFFVVGLVRDSIQIIKQKFKISDNAEFITTGGFILTYCSLGISKYQLPHYIYVVLPLIAIITAKLIYSLYWENKFKFVFKILTPIQWMVCTALLIAPFLILTHSFPTIKTWPWVIPIGTVLLSLFIVLNKKTINKIIYLSLTSIVGLNIFLSAWFYPELLKYQVGNIAGRFIKDNKIDNEKFFLYKFEGNTKSIHFYAGRIVRETDSVNNLLKNTFLLTNSDGLYEIKTKGRSFTILKEGVDFHISALTVSFLNKKTRDKQGLKYFIINLN